MFQQRLRAYLRPAAALCASAGSAFIHADGASSTPQVLAVIGGHDGMLVEHGKVFKPLQSDARGRKELDFYQRVCHPEAHCHAPCKFMPKFYGLTEFDEPAGSTAAALSEGGDSTKPDSSRDPSTAVRVPYIVLENLLAPFGIASQMDLKVGIQTWDDDAPPEKAVRERTKYPPQQQLGFRFTGMRVWDAKAGAYKEHGRSFGYGLDNSTISAAFHEFFHDGTRVRAELLPPLIERLESIRAWFEGQSDFRFYGSSLLFVYDSSREEPVVDVRMIDFAHVWPIAAHEKPHGRDSGYLLGITRIIHELKVLHALATYSGADAGRTDTVSRGNSSTYGTGSVCSQCNGKITGSGATGSTSDRASDSSASVSAPTAATLLA